MKAGTKRLALLALFIVVLPFGWILYAMLKPTQLAAQIDPEWKPSQRILMWSRIWTTFYRTVPLPLLLAIFHNEGASVARPLSVREANAINVEPGTVAYPPGDLDISRGPSVGCGQVLRTNVERLWQEQRLGSLSLRGLVMNIHDLVIFDDARKLALVGNERGAVWASIMMLRECLNESGGDLREAARRYNGSGDSAEQYAARVIDSVDRTA